MKFHCTRCKTRYSIADERVKGKVLKIRCKNCSAVISVREGMDSHIKRQATAPPLPGARTTPETKTTPETNTSPESDKEARGRAKRESDGRAALKDAFSSALTVDNRPASDSLSMPPTASDWYVSEDGRQEGPYGLDQAKQWIRERASTSELHCWADGFDDWQPVEDVPQLAGVRQSAIQFGDNTVVQGHPMAGYLDNIDETVPAPSFSPYPGPSSPDRVSLAANRGGADLGAVDSDMTVPAPNFSPSDLGGATEPEMPRPSGRGLPSQLGHESPGHRPHGSNGESAGGEHDLEIGEVSKVIRLPTAGPGSLPPPQGHAGGPIGYGTGPVGAFGGAGGYVGGTGGYPMLGGTGGVPALGGTGPAPHLGYGPVGYSTGAAVALQAARSKRRNRILAVVGGLGAVAVIGILLVLMLASTGDEVGEEDPLLRSRFARENLGYDVDRPDRKSGDSGKDQAEPDETKEPKDKGSSTGSRKSGTKSTKSSTTVSDLPDEVDLGSGGSADSRQRELGPEDVEKVVAGKRYPVKRCYENAKKRDPFLEAKPARVTVVIDTEGKVQSVSIPGRADDLGRCLTSRIKSWRFPKAERGPFRGQFTLVFK